MKVKLGEYTSWLGPHQLAKKLCFWAKREEDEYGFEKTPDWVHDFGEWLAHGSVEKESEVAEIESWGSEDRPITLLFKFLNWIESKKSRKELIQIDPWDTWSMDRTLSLIILPMLIQLKETKHGSPSVEDKDVPKALRSTSAPAVADEWDSDDNFHKRWEWVLNEMIWAFTQLNDDDNDSQFHTGVHDTIMVPIDKDDNEIVGQPKDKIKFYRMDRTDKDTSVYDKKGHAKHTKRIQRGTTLFGKYYRGLWD